MLAIKLKVVGRKNQRTFRVIVQEARSKLGGKFVEDLGWYNPHTNQYKINKDRVAYWISNGAQPTETVGRILKKVKTSDTETYETRKGRKRKKAKAVKDSLPDADASRGPREEVVEGDAKAQADAGEAGSDAEETPSDEAPAVSPETSKEENPKEEHEESQRESASNLRESALGTIEGKKESE